MLNLFAGAGPDRLDIPALLELHAAGPLVLTRRAEADLAGADLAQIHDDGELSATAAVTTLLRLAAVGAFCLAEGGPERATSPVALAHLRHVVRRAQEQDERIVALLEAAFAAHPDTPAEAAGGLSGRASPPPAERADMPSTETPKTALDHVRDSLAALKAKTEAAATGAQTDPAHDAAFDAALAALQASSAADEARLSSLESRAGATDANITGLIGRVDAAEERLNVLEEGAEELDDALAYKPSGDGAPASDAPPASTTGAADPAASGQTTAS